MARIHLGTSGWHYAHWVGPFYPKGMALDDALAYYGRHFATAEINNTFYQLPKTATFTKWREATPRDFVFACKASRYITHMKKLKDPAASTASFFDAVQCLGGKLGPILFQLPPRWTVDPDRLQRFLEALPRGYRYAFEFRDRSWFTEDLRGVLQAHDAACCVYDLDGWRSPTWVTADFAYVRLHGPDGPYRGQYDGRTLAGWARRIDGWRRDGLDVYCYFDNDEAGYAATDALRLSTMLAKLSSKPRSRGRQHSVSKN